MPQLRRRPTAPVVIAATVLFGVFAGPVPEARPLFQPRPGPIDHPLAIAAADFDRDGRDDLAFAAYQAGVVEILLGQANGTFLPSAESPVGVGTATFSTPTTGPQGLIVFDLNPQDVDGDTIPNASDNCPNVPNGPEATEGSQIDANTNGVGNACEAGEDTDDDGDVDVTVDTDGDGVLDFDPVTFRLDNCPRRPNPGQEDTETAQGPDGMCGTIDDNTLLYGTDALCGTTDDRTGDRVGDACAASPDLLVLTNSVGGGSTLGTVRVRVNNGTGGFLNRPSYVTGVGPGQAILADVSGDRLVDLLIANVSIDLVQVFLGIGDAQFTGGSLLTAGDGPQAIVAADIDNDGDLDPITADSAAGTLSLFRNAPGALGPSPSETFTTGTHPAVLLSGNLNGDAFADIVVLTQGALTCTGPPMGTLTGRACTIDKDCDDLFTIGQDGTCSGGDGGVQVFAGAPASPPPGLVAGPLVSFGPGHRPRAAKLRDLNGDTFLDLAVADFAGGEILILPGNGDGTFGTAAVLPINGQPGDLAFLTLDPATPSDLAVLDTAGRRIDLFEQTAGLSYAAAPVTPASPWRDTRGMALIAADGLVAFDVVLLQQQGARVDVLSGIGDGSFRVTPALRPEGAANGSGFVTADLRQDGRPDLAIFDSVAGTVTVFTGELNGLLEERGTVSAGAGAARADATPLYESIVDYDRDGVPNVLDDCPTVYNPPMCKTTDPLCTPVIPFVCTDDVLAPNDCDPAAIPPQLDPVTGQCDSDRNGIGDLCQVLGAAEATTGTCFAVDSDFDLKADYDHKALKKDVNGALDFDGDTFANTVDNCPTMANVDQKDGPPANGIGDACEVLGSGQTVDPDGDLVPTWNPITQAVDNCPLIPNKGQEDNDGDRVGNACIVAAALDNCLGTFNANQQDGDGDGLGDACAVPPQDLFLLSPDPPGAIAVLQGDGSGTLRDSPISPLTGLSGPLAVRSGHFSLACSPQGAFCSDKSELHIFDLAIAEAGTLGDPSDDAIALRQGDGAGGFTALPAFPVTGDPSLILRAQDQPVCPIASSPTNPQLRFDPDVQTDLLVALGTADSTLHVLLPSNQNYLNAALSPLVRPVAFDAPLPVTGSLRDVVLANVNQDALQDLVAISTSGGTTTITPFIGLGNGLFFTDPGLVTTNLPFDASRLQSANVDIKTDVVYPDLVLFESRDEAPFSLLNTLPERADIDSSGRVDGYDLALLAASFGAARGEDFTLLPDATFARTGSGATEVIVRTGSAVPGQDLPDSAGACNIAFDAGSGSYGVPVDINLDGIVDGEDLAFLASRFGTTLR